MHQGPTSWLLLLPFLPHDEKYIHVNGAVVVFLFILVCSIFARLAIRNKEEALVVPAPKFTLATLVDVVVELLHNLVISILGHHGEKHFPFIAAMFLFIFFSNVLGLLPLSEPPTANTNTTFALGLCSFAYYHLMGIREQGLAHYGKHFLLGLGFAGIPIALLEMISHFIRPISLGMRLFLNLHIDHALVNSFAQLCAWLLPVPLLLFGVVVCTIQAFLFAILTSVYIQMATEHE